MPFDSQWGLEIAKVWSNINASPPQIEVNCVLFVKICKNKSRESKKAPAQCKQMLTFCLQIVSNKAGKPHPLPIVC